MGCHPCAGRLRLTSVLRRRRAAPRLGMRGRLLAAQRRPIRVPPRPFPSQERRERAGGWALPAPSVDGSAGLSPPGAAGLGRTGGRKESGRGGGSESCAGGSPRGTGSADGEERSCSRCARGRGREAGAREGGREGGRPGSGLGSPEPRAALSAGERVPPPGGGHCLPPPSRAASSGREPRCPPPLLGPDPPEETLSRRGAAPGGVGAFYRRRRLPEGGQRHRSIGVPERRGPGRGRD